MEGIDYVRRSRPFPSNDLFFHLAESSLVALWQKSFREKLAAVRAPAALIDTAWLEPSTVPHSTPGV